MAQVYCKQHKDKNLFPVMIYFGDNSLGREYICAVCSGVRVFNTGEIISLKSGYGFINNQKDNIFFHFSNLADDFEPYLGQKVSYEVSFIEHKTKKIQAINVRPAGGGN